jgi:putative tryptophan/tyrosine transport system substrate-binding protein
MDPRRRALAALLAIALPARAFAAEPRVVGMLMQGSGSRSLARAMAELGWAEGSGVRYLVRKAGPDGSSPQRGATELIYAGAGALVGEGQPCVVALARATRTIPIVSAGISDPIGEGVAESLRRPGRNVTGLSYGLPEAALLQLAALRSILPGFKRLVFLVPMDYDRTRPAPEHEAAAAAAGIATELVRVADIRAFERTVAGLRPASDAAWVAVLPPGVTLETAAAVALKSRIATHSLGTEGVKAGLLMSYWLTYSDMPRRVAAILDKVLRGQDPAKIPFEMPDRTEFALNRSTAAALGLRIPEDTLLRATEVMG